MLKLRETSFQTSHVANTYKIQSHLSATPTQDNARIAFIYHTVFYSKNKFYGNTYDIANKKKMFQSNQVKSYRPNSKYFVEHPPILTYLIINSHSYGCEKLTCFFSNNK